MATPMKTPTAPCSFAPSPLLPRPLLVLLVLVVAPACTDDSREGPVTELEEVTANQILYGTSQRLTRNGVQEGLLEADSIYMWDDSTHVRIFGLVVFLYNEFGHEKGRVTAVSGRLSEMGRQLWAYGDALLDLPADEMNDRRIIRSEELFFDLDDERIWTGVAVRMQRGLCDVTGDGFESDLSFNNLIIEAPREAGCSEP